MLNWTFFKKSWQSFSNDTVTVFKCKDSQCWTGPLGLWDTVSVSVSVSVYLLSVQMVGQTTAAEASDGFSCDYVWMERFCPAQTELGGNFHRFFIFILCWWCTDIFGGRDCELLFFPLLHGHESWKQDWNWVRVDADWSAVAARLWESDCQATL